MVADPVQVAIIPTTRPARWRCKPHPAVERGHAEGERARTEALRTARTQVLETAVRDAPLPEALETLVHIVEGLSPSGVLASVLLLGPGPGARCVRVIGTAIDITACRRVEAELRESNERLEQRVIERTTELRRFREIVDATISPIRAFDTEHRLVALTRRTARRFGGSTASTASSATCSRTCSSPSSARSCAR